MSDPTDAVRDAYDTRPWPDPGTVHGPSLPDPWLHAPSGRFGLPDGARILVAGCGTGGEAAAMAARHPGAEVVGVDLSSRSIAFAQQAFPELDFAVADLARTDLSEHGRFDLISCHAVADYVPDGAALMANLARALAPRGVLYLGVNTEHHPGRRVRGAMARLGLDAHGWVEHPVHRAGLRAIQGLLGEAAQIADLADQPTGLLAADVFPAFSHGTDLTTWTGWANGAGLQLGGSLAALWALPRVGDSDLPLLYGLDRGDLAELVESLQRNAVLQLVFTADPAPTPPWTDLGALFAWSAHLHPILGREHLPPLAGDWMARRSLAVHTPGLPTLTLAPTAWMLELLRRCNGTRSLAEVRAGMPAEAHDEHLRATLYRAWQAGLVHLTPAG